MNSFRIQVLHLDGADCAVHLHVRSLHDQPCGGSLQLYHRQRPLVSGESDLYGPDRNVHFQLDAFDLLAAGRLCKAHYEVIEC